MWKHYTCLYDKEPYLTHTKKTHFPTQIKMWFCRSTYSRCYHNVTPCLYSIISVKVGHEYIILVYGKKYYLQLHTSISQLSGKLKLIELVKFSVGLFHVCILSTLSYFACVSCYEKRITAPSQIYLISKL